MDAYINAARTVCKTEREAQALALRMVKANVQPTALCAMLMQTPTPPTTNTIYRERHEL